MASYFAKAKPDNVRETVQQEKSGGWKWFTKEEIENAVEIAENIRFYAVKALEQLSVNKTAYTNHGKIYHPL